MSPQLGTLALARRAAQLFLLVGTLVVVALVPVASASSTVSDAEGTLTVSSSPAVATQIRVGGIIRNTSRIAGLSLSPGEYEVCMSAPDGYLPPACERVTVSAGELTTLVGHFVPAGTLQALIEPAGLEATVIVDGVVRDRGQVLLPVVAGEHEVCVEDLGGYEPVPCQQVSITAGELSTVTAVFVPAATAPEPVPDPDPAPDPDPDPAPDPEPRPGPAPEPDDVTLVDVIDERATNDRGRSWTATVGLAARRGGEPVAGAVITGSFAPGDEVACLTAPDGTCEVAQTGIHNRDKSVTFTVTQVSGTPTQGPTSTVTR
jgi:hypothetical protein